MLNTIQNNESKYRRTIRTGRLLDLGQQYSIYLIINADVRHVIDSPSPSPSSRESMVTKVRQNQYNH